MNLLNINAYLKPNKDGWLTRFLQATFKNWENKFLRPEESAQPEQPAPE